MFILDIIHYLNIVRFLVLFMRALCYCEVECVVYIFSISTPIYDLYLIFCLLLLPDLCASTNRLIYLSIY